MVFIHEVILTSHKQNLKWSVRQRLEFLENHLYWRGQINRKTIMDETGVSKAQASLDLTLYKKHAHNNLTYSLSDKTYYISDRFKPLYIDTHPECFLRSQTDEFKEEISFPFRNINTSHLRIIHKAVENQTWVIIEYQSLTGRPKSIRTIAPHNYVSDGRRWHLRAYDFSVSEFRDFVLGRIINANEADFQEVSETHDWQQDFDEAWHEHAELILVPHPGLTEDQRAIIEVDYCMEDGQTSFKVRIACLFYVIIQMQLLDESPEPKVQQVVLKNRDEIESLVNIPRKLR